MAPALKFSQITASLANFTTSDVLIGVQNATSDRTFTYAQIASGVLSTATLVTATISSSTINTSTINNSTLGTATINNSTIGTATINNSTLNTATIANATINTSTLNTTTINNATINTATINTATLNQPTLNNAVLSAPTLTNPVLSTATINTATIGNAVINTATINTGTLNNVTLNTSTLNTTTINNASVNTAVIVKSSLNLLNTLTPTQVGSTVDTTSLTAAYNRYRITFENVCPVSTATLTCSLNLQIATNGVNWITSNTSYVSSLMVCTNGTTLATAVTTSAFIIAGGVSTYAISTSTQYGVTGWMEIANPSNAVFVKQIIGQVSYLNFAAPLAVQAFPSGFSNIGASITGIAIAFQTGNIATGTIRIYGIK